MTTLKKQLYIGAAGVTQLNDTKKSKQVNKLKIKKLVDNIHRLKQRLEEAQQELDDCVKVMVAESKDGAKTPEEVIVPTVMTAAVVAAAVVAGGIRQGKGGPRRRELGG